MNSYGVVNTITDTHVKLGFSSRLGERTLPKRNAALTKQMFIAMFKDISAKGEIISAIVPEATNANGQSLVASDEYTHKDIRVPLVLGDVIRYSHLSNHNLTIKLVMRAQSHEALYTAMGELRISSHNLLERFGITVSVQRPVDALAKLEEEVREVRVEVLSAERERAVDESVDVLVTLMNLWRALGATDAELITAMRRVAQKNDAKTEETHERDRVRNTVKRKVGK